MRFIEQTVQRLACTTNLQTADDVKNAQWQFSNDSKLSQVIKWLIVSLCEGKTKNEYW